MDKKIDRERKTQLQEGIRAQQKEIEYLTEL